MFPAVRKAYSGFVGTHSKVKKMNKKSVKQFSKSALAISAMAFAISAAYADNEIYIGKATSNDIASLTISQSGAAAVNRIGASASDRFNVDGKWNSISITQTNATALGAATGSNTLVGVAGDADYSPARSANSSAGNVITGSIKNASTGTGNSATLVQTGDGNRIVLAVGASAAPTGTAVVGISQIGSRNSSTYTMNHTGNLTVAETTAGDHNVVSVTSSGGTNYSNTIALTGNNNAVTVTRSGAFTTNTDSITLTGNLNTVTLGGTATGTNSVTLAAVGNNNVFGITQSGAGSMANINVATNYKNFNVTQATAGSQFSLTGTLTNSGSVSITQ